MEKVAGFLEVGRTDDTHEVVISHPNPELDADGTARIVVSPRHARYLANLLTEHAMRAEAEAAGERQETTSHGPRNRDKRSTQPK
jgi:hypothetical protein